MGWALGHATDPDDRGSFYLTCTGCGGPVYTEAAVVGLVVTCPTCCEETEVGRLGGDVVERRGGTAELSGGFLFTWYLTGKRLEVHGGIERPEGGYVKESSGFWATSDPATAIRRAEVLLGDLREEGKI